MASLDVGQPFPSRLSPPSLKMDALSGTPHGWRSCGQNIGERFYTSKNDSSRQFANDDCRTQCHSNENDLWADLDVVVPPCNLAFVYGTLKKGFGNHWLMEELMSTGHAQYVGSACTKCKFPLVCGPFSVPFLLHIPAAGHHVRGEVYQVDDSALAKLDDLEGVSKGHYIRRPILITDFQVHPAVVGDGFNSTSLNSLTVLAEAYFAAADYTPDMSLALYIDCYSEKEASSYIRRKDRPQDRTFLEHIHAWIKNQQYKHHEQDAHSRRYGAFTNLHRCNEGLLC